MLRLQANSSDLYDDSFDPALYYFIQEFVLISLPEIAERRQFESPTSAISLVKDMGNLEAKARSPHMFYSDSLVIREDRSSGYACDIRMLPLGRRYSQAFETQQKELTLTSESNSKRSSVSSPSIAERVLASLEPYSAPCWIGSPEMTLLYKGTSSA